MASSGVWYLRGDMQRPLSVNPQADRRVLHELDLSQCDPRIQSEDYGR
jgi:hypothetical protein